MNCPHCNGWRHKPGDRYCGHCGKPLFDRHRVLVVPDDPRTFRGSLTVENRGDFRGVFELEGPRWLELDRARVELEPGARQDVGFRVRPERMGGTVMGEGYVVIKQDSSVVREILVQVYPVPRGLSPKAARDLVVYDCDREATWILKMPCPVSGELTLRPLADIGRLATVERTVVLDMGENRIPLTVQATGQGTADVEFELVAPRSEGGARLRGKFVLTVKRPPTIYVEDSSPTPAGRMRAGRDAAPDEKPGVFPLKVRNAGDDPLHIRDIEFRTQSADVRWERDLKPLEIGPGETKTADLHYTTTPTASTQEPILTELRFDADDPVRPVIELVLRVVEKVDPGFLAVDYGTSTSSAAVFSREAQNVLLEDKKPRIVSDVYFSRYDPDAEPQYDYAIGKKAEAWRNPKRRAHAVKVMLGSGKKVEIELNEYPHRLAPEYVANLAVMELIRFARQGWGRRPSGLVFTLPTRFSLRQVRIAEETYTRAATAKGLRFKPKFVDEAFAAGFYYLCDGIAADPDLCCRDGYDLLVMDMGGGTTDVTLFRVKQIPGGDGRLPQPQQLEVMGAWGDQNLGGTALSRMIEDYVRERHGELLPYAGEALKLAVSEYLKLPRGKGQPVAAGPAAPADRALLARSIVRCDEGEFADLAGSLRTRDLLPEEVNMVLEKVGDSRGFSMDTSLSGRQRSAIVKVEEVTKLLQPRLDSFALEVRAFLERTGAGRPPDKLLLCGQASLLPLVPNTFAKFASKYDYVRGPRREMRLKESVALGAALYASYGAAIPVKGRADKFWRELGVMRYRWQSLVPWGAVPGQHRCECSFGPFDIVEGERDRPFIRFTLQENHSLIEGRETPVPYQVFELELESGGATQYEGLLVLKSDGSVEMFCKLGDSLVPMKPVNMEEVG